MKSIEGVDVSNKKVIVRVDYNCPIKDGKVYDDTKIKASLKTINYLIEHNAIIILLSHLGRIEKEEDKIDKSLEPTASYLSRLVPSNVYFMPITRGNVLDRTINNLKPKEILVIENTRFEDFPSKLESSCDESLSKYWASLGDLFVLDAFGSSHRNHASTYGISKYIPSYAGFLVIKEKGMLDQIISKDNTLIMGGSKVADKIKLIDNLIDKTDKFLIGGAMCFTFLKAKGYNVGESYVEDDSIPYATELLNKNGNKIVLPVDIVTKIGVREVTDMDDDDIGYDIGPKTIELFKNNLSESNLILWNGPLGKYEEDDYDFGTRKILEYLKSYKEENTILAGGDIISAANKCMIEFPNMCTGGGATLEYLEGKEFKTFSRLDGESNY